MPNLAQDTYKFLENSNNFRTYPHSMWSTFTRTPMYTKYIALSRQKGTDNYRLYRLQVYEDSHYEIDRTHDLKSYSCCFSNNLAELIKEDREQACETTKNPKDITKFLMAMELLK